MGGNINSSNVNLTDRIPPDMAKMLQAAHDAGNAIMVVGSVVGAAGVVLRAAPVAEAGAAVVLAGAGVRGLAYVHEMWFELCFFQPTP